MEITSSKWEILNILAQKPSAPLEIAKTLQTTIANVSQQLRLLEAAGLVTRKKVPNSQAGKPRALFSLKEDFCDIIIVTKDSADKRHIKLTPKQAFLSKTILYEEAGLALAKWFLNQKSVQKPLYLKEIQNNKILLESTPGPKEKVQEKIEINEQEYHIEIQFVQQSNGKVLYK